MPQKATKKIGSCQDELDLEREAREEKIDLKGKGFQFVVHVFAWLLVLRCMVWPSPPSDVVSVFPLFIEAGNKSDASCYHGDCFSPSHSVSLTAIGLPLGS